MAFIVFYYPGFAVFSETMFSMFKVDKSFSSILSVISGVYIVC